MAKAGNLKLDFMEKKESEFTFFGLNTLNTLDVIEIPKPKKKRYQSLKKRPFGRMYTLNELDDPLPVSTSRTSRLAPTRKG